MSSTTGESWAKIGGGSNAASSSYVPIDSDASWDQVSDHRDCQHAHEIEETDWESASRPASPPLDVPPSQSNIWLRVAQVTDDRKVAMQLHEELERRPFRLPSKAAESTVMSFLSEDTLSPFSKDMTPVRHAKTPPPAPDGELEHALKAFQESEGARLYGFAQCDGEARAALVAFLVGEGNDEDTAILIADELDGVEEKNGLARNEHGCWYRISEGEEGRKRKFDPGVLPSEHHASWAEYYASATRQYAPSTTSSLSMQRMRNPWDVMPKERSQQPKGSGQRNVKLYKSEPIRFVSQVGKPDPADLENGLRRGETSGAATDTFGQALMKRWAEQDREALMRPPNHSSPASSNDIEWEEIVAGPVAFPPDEEERKPVIIAEEMKPRVIRLSQLTAPIEEWKISKEHPMRQMLREREEEDKGMNADDW